MTAIIADDEELARRLMREYLEGESGIEILAEAANGFDAVKVVVGTQARRLISRRSDAPARLDLKYWS